MDEAFLRIQALEAQVECLRKQLEACQQIPETLDPLFHTLLEQTPDHIYFKDAHSRFLCGSRAVAESFRLSNPEDLKGRTDFDFFSEEHARKTYEDEQEILRTGMAKVDLEEAVVWPSGEVTWISTTKVPLRDAEGAIVGTFGISRNITERKRAEEALRLSEERFRLLFDHAVDGILMGSSEGVIIGANDAACALTGWPKAELLGLHITRLFEEKTLITVPLRFDLLKAGQRVISERELIRRDGSAIRIEMHTKMMPDGTYQAIFRNLTERQRQQEALCQSEESYRGLFNSVQEAIYIQDREGRFVDVNQGAVEMYGHPREYYLGKTPEIVSAPGMNDLEHLGGVLQRAFAGEPQCFEFWGIRANGEVFPKEVRVYKGMYFGRDVVIALAQDISERKRAEKALKDSERHYRELLDRLEEGFAFADTQETIVFANPAASEIFGVHEGLTGHNLREFLDEDAWALMVQQTARRRLGERGHYELPIHRPDGQRRVLSLGVSPWIGDDGKYLGSTGIFIDVTEQKEAREALERSERNFRQLVEKLGEGFCFVDVEERFTYANAAAGRIFGIGPEGLAGHSIREFVDDDTFVRIRVQTAQRKQGTTSTYEIQIRRPSGEERTLSLTASPFLTETGEFLGADGLFMDITERKQAELALRESEERYRELFNNSTDAIFWLLVEPDGAFRVEAINPAEEALLNMSQTAICGHTLSEILPPEMAEPVIANFHRCLEVGAPIRYEERVDFPAGSKVFMTQLVPIRNPQGRIYRIVGFSQDITQAKQAEEALRQAQKLESLGVLAGGIAHDFNNLLTAILGNLNLAQIKSAPESPAQPYLENVERTVLKAAELTKQMLAYSGRGRFVVKPHDLNQVVQEMTHLLNVSISKKALLRYDLAPELPPIEADAAQIQQVVMNLVTNASEAIGDRDGVIAVATRLLGIEESMLHTVFLGQALKPGPHVVLEVSDTGSGIPPEILERIFDPFFTTKQSGRGLGLSAMQGILRGHHAGIRIQSEPGRGTTFTLYFPISAMTAAPADTAVIPTGNLRFRGRVLLVDDEVEVRASTEGMLEMLGFEVATAADGQEGLERFESPGSNFDLVLLDLTMPRMDGREAFRQLRRIRPNLPVILSSGYSEHESLQETLSQGFAGFLQKPFLLADLRRLIQQVLPKA
jgi:PAS domain S-box-containing protein